MKNQVLLQRQRLEYNSTTCTCTETNGKEKQGVLKCNEIILLLLICWICVLFPILWILCTNKDLLYHQDTLLLMTTIAVFSCFLFPASCIVLVIWKPVHSSPLKICNVVKATKGHDDEI